MHVAAWIYIYFKIERESKIPIINKMSKHFGSRPIASFLVIVAAMMMVAIQEGPLFVPIARAFTRPTPLVHRHDDRSVVPTLTTSLAMSMDKKNKFNKQRDLAEKMAQAKRQREGSDDGSSSNTISSSSSSADSSSFTSSSSLSAAEEIKLRNDRKRFADLLENSPLAGGGGGNDMGRGFYLTVEQENENANAVYKGVLRLYEGDTAPITPFAELLCIESGEPIGEGGMLRLLPWEGSANNKSSYVDDYLVIIADPRPKSIELRTAMRRITDTLESTVLEKVVIINTDTPAENRRLMKKNYNDKDAKFRILCDENMEWMREYTALGEKVCLNLQLVVVMFVVLLLNNLHE